MFYNLKKAALVLMVLATLSACTSPSMSHLMPPVGRVVMDDPTPPPCPTCDTDGGLPRI